MRRGKGRSRPEGRGRGSLETLGLSARPGCCRVPSEWEETASGGWAVGSWPRAPGSALKRGLRGSEAGTLRWRQESTGSQRAGDHRGVGLRAAELNWPGGPRLPDPCPQRWPARTACGTWIGMAPGIRALTASSSPSAAGLATSGTAAGT